MPFQLLFGYEFFAAFLPIYNQAIKFNNILELEGRDCDDLPHIQTLFHRHAIFYA